MWTALLTSNPAVQTATEGDTSLTFWGKRQFEQPRRCQPWVERKNLGNLVDRKWRENAEKGIPERGGGRGGWRERAFFCCLSQGSSWCACDSVGLLYMKSGKPHISGLSIPDFTSLSSPHLKSKEWSVMWKAQMATVSLSEEGKEVRHPTLALGFLFPPHLQFSSRDFFLFEKTSIPCKFECLL